jgi:hypothetical protein
MPDMPAPPFAVPSPVLDWIRNVFAEVNRRSAATLTRIPTTFETTLDHGVIAHLAEYAAPFKFSSDWIVTTNNLYCAWAISYGGSQNWSYIYQPNWTPNPSFYFARFDPGKRIPKRDSQIMSWCFRASPGSGIFLEN